MPRYEVQIEVAKPETHTVEVQLSRRARGLQYLVAELRYLLKRGALPGIPRDGPVPRLVRVRCVAPRQTGGREVVPPAPLRPTDEDEFRQRLTAAMTAIFAALYRDPDTGEIDADSPDLRRGRPEDFLDEVLQIIDRESLFDDLARLARKHAA